MDNFTSLNFFYNYLEEFLTDLLNTGSGLNKKVEALKAYYNDGNKVKTIELFNSSIKNYESRFLNLENDPNVIKRINNPIFFHLTMTKTLSNAKLSVKDRDTIFQSLRMLYFYSELHCNPKRKDLKELGEKCKPSLVQKSGENSNGDLDSRISKATDMVKKLLMKQDGIGSQLAPGVDFSQFGDLIEKIGKSVGEEIKNNGGNIDTNDIFEKLKSGNINADNGFIGGINIKNIIDNVSKSGGGGEITASQSPENLKAILNGVLNKKLNENEG